MIDLVSAFGLGLIAYKLIELNYPESDYVKNDSDSSSDSGQKPIPISQYRIEKEWSNEDETACVYSLHFDTMSDDGSLESTYFYGYIIGNYSGTSFVKAGEFSNDVSSISGTHTFKLNGKSYTNVLIYPSLSEAIIEIEDSEETSPEDPQSSPDEDVAPIDPDYYPSNPDYSGGFGGNGYGSIGVL